jgi:ParB/RepB/Spo0J family partition protein
MSEMPVKKRIIQVPFESIVADADFNCRKDYIEIEELKQSIYDQGLLQPVGVTVRGNDTDRYFLVYGFRRYYALKKLREEHGPDFYAVLDVVINEGNLEDMRVRNLRENIDRKQLSTYEISQQVRRMVQAGMDQREIGAKLGRNQSWVSYHYKVATQLAPEAQTALRTGAITLDQALYIADVPEEEQKELVGQVLNSDSRAEAKQLLKDAASESGKRRKYSNKGRPSAKNLVQYVSDVSYEAESKINAKDEKAFFNGVAAGLRIALGDTEIKEIKPSVKYSDTNYHSKDNKVDDAEDGEDTKAADETPVTGIVETPVKRRGRPRKNPVENAR